MEHASNAYTVLEHESNLRTIVAYPRYAKKQTSSTKVWTIKEAILAKKELLLAGFTAIGAAIIIFVLYLIVRRKLKEEAKFEKLIQKYSEGADEYEKDDDLILFNKVGYALFQAAQIVGNTDDVKAILEKTPPKNWIRITIRKASSIEGNTRVLKILLDNKNTKFSKGYWTKLVENAADEEIKQLLQAYLYPQK